MSLYQYYGQFEPKVDEFIHKRYFPNDPRGGILLEAGAFDGITESSGKFFEESLGWKCINVEASSRIYTELFNNRPNSMNLNMVLSNNNGKAVFRDVNFPGYELCTNSSLSHLPEHKIWLDNNGCEYVEQMVETVTYPSLIKKLAINRIDLMILDVEGHELEVIVSMYARDIILPNVLCIEHGHLGVNVITKKLEPLGYLYDISSHVNSFYIRRSLPQIILELDSHNKALMNSTSWRLTKPLRKLKEKLTRG